MLAVALIFVGITLFTNGVLILGKADPKTMSFMNIVTVLLLSEVTLSNSPKPQR